MFNPLWFSSTLTYIADRAVCRPHNTSDQLLWVIFYYGKLLAFDCHRLNLNISFSFRTVMFLKYYLFFSKCKWGWTVLGVLCMGGKQKMGLTKKYWSEGNKYFKYFLFMFFFKKLKKSWKLEKTGLRVFSEIWSVPFHPIQTVRNGFIHHFFIYEAILANFTPK